MAGIPVYSQAGKGGGWSLVGGARTDLTGLTAAEARTLFMVAGPSAAATPEAKAALRKLVQALPETFRADAEAAASAVMLDPAKWGTTTAPRPAHLDALQRAVVDGLQVRLGYSDRTRASTERIIHPLGLVEKGSVWYLVADTEAGLRTFRVGRVRSVEVTADPVRRPDGFDLASVWQEVVETIEERRTVVRTTVRAPGWAVNGLHGQFGTTVSVVARARGRSSGCRDRHAVHSCDRPAARRVGSDDRGARTGRGSPATRSNRCRTRRALSGELSLTPVRPGDPLPATPRAGRARAARGAGDRRSTFHRGPHRTRWRADRTTRRTVRSSSPLDDHCRPV